jgi:fructoselysine-6-phosphate deglycase
MLNLDPSRFLGIQSGAVALAPAIHQAVGGWLQLGGRNVFLLGTGGAAILMLPALQLLQRRSSLPAFTDIAAELVIAGHPALGQGSLVVIPSVSGTTKESIAALEYCRARGATVFSLVGHAGTPLAEKANRTFVNFSDDPTASESLYLQSLLVALSAMAHRGEFPDYEKTVVELMTLPAQLLAAKQSFDAEAQRLAETLAGESYHIITGAGSSWAPAWYYSMCVLEEQQWLRTRPIQAADFFHGTFELVEPGVSVVVMKGEDHARPLCDRVEAFARRYTGRLTVLDAAASGMPGISAETRALISPVILATILERLTVRLAAARRHPLDQRRYYKKVSY